VAPAARYVTVLQVPCETAVIKRTALLKQWRPNLAHVTLSHRSALMPWTFDRLTSSDHAKMQLTARQPATIL
jgi:hypothetical protein